MSLCKILICFVSAVSLLVTFAFADELDIFDASEQIKQTEAETPEPLEVSESTSIVQDEQPESEIGGSSAATDEHNAQIDPYTDEPFSEWWLEDNETDETMLQEYTTYEVSDYEYQLLVKLTSIEFQLKIIAGGVILTAIIFFLWLTVFNVIKKFSYF